MGEFGLAGHNWAFSIFHLIFVEFVVAILSRGAEYRCRSACVSVPWALFLDFLVILFPCPCLHTVLSFRRSRCRMPCPFHYAQPYRFQSQYTPSTCLLSVQKHSLEVESESGVVLLDENSRCSLDGFSPNSTLIVDDPLLSCSVELGIVVVEGKGMVSCYPLYAIV